MKQSTKLHFSHRNQRYVENDLDPGFWNSNGNQTKSLKKRMDQLHAWCCASLILSAIMIVVICMLSVMFLYNHYRILGGSCRMWCQYPATLISFVVMVLLLGYSVLNAYRTYYILDKKMSVRESELAWIIVANADLDFGAESLFYISLVIRVSKEMPVGYTITLRQRKMVCGLFILDLYGFAIFSWIIYTILIQENRNTKLDDVSIVELLIVSLVMFINDVVISWYILYYLFYKTLYRLIRHYEISFGELQMRRFNDKKNKKEKEEEKEKSKNDCSNNTSDKPVIGRNIDDVDNMYTYTTKTDTEATDADNAIMTAAEMLLDRNQLKTEQEDIVHLMTKITLLGIVVMICCLALHILMFWRNWDVAFKIRRPLMYNVPCFVVRSIVACINCIGLYLTFPFDDGRYLKCCGKFHNFLAQCIRKNYSRNVMRDREIGLRLLCDHQENQTLRVKSGKDDHETNSGVMEIQSYNSFADTRLNNIVVDNTLYG